LGFVIFAVLIPLRFGQGGEFLRGLFIGRPSLLYFGDVLVKLGDDPDFAIDEMEKIEEDIEIKTDRTTIYTPAYKSYESDNIAVMTDTANEQEAIKAIFIDTEGIYTRRGIGVGDPMEKVYKKYGKNYKSMYDTILYQKTQHGETHYILFQVDDETDTVFSYAILDKMPNLYKNIK
jgi:hypothetical protein